MSMDISDRLQPSNEIADSTNKRDLSYLLLGLFVILSGALLNVIYLIHQCPLDLAGDEAHYWEWSRRLDLSYYSKGPLVAYIIAVGRVSLSDISVRLVGNEMLAVRLPAILLSVASGIGMFLLAVRATGRPRVGLLTVLISATVPLFSAGAFLMTIDAPLICAWTWALVCLERVFTRFSLPQAIFAGVLIALGILAKYTMVLILPAIGITWLCCQPGIRRQLRNPLLVVLLIGISGFVPIVVWNASHGWVSVKHVAGQAGVSGRVHLDPASPFEYLLGQAVVTNPIWFIGIFVAVRTWLNSARTTGRVWRASISSTLLVSAALVPWCVFLVFSLLTKTQPNWPAPSLVSAIVLLSDWAEHRLFLADRAATSRRLFASIGVVIGLSFAVLARNTHWLSPLFGFLARGSPSWELTPAAKYDPTSRLRGWSNLAAIEPIWDKLLSAGGDPFIVADDYQLASEIAFYMPSHPVVYCVQSALGDRQSQYDIWNNPILDHEEFVGRPCLYVGQLKREITGDDRTPAALPGLTKVATIEHKVGDLRYQLWTVYTCASFAGFENQPARTRKY